MIVGFTGTREGMSNRQELALILLMQQLLPNEFHHGICIGADARAHNIVLQFSKRTKIYGYPGSGLAGSRTRAKGLTGFARIHIELPYLLRDRAIVEALDLLIAAPRSMEEIVRSGTWATVRYARRKLKPVILLDR